MVEYWQTRLEFNVNHTDLTMMTIHQSNTFPNILQRQSKNTLKEEVFDHSVSVH